MSKQNQMTINAIKEKSHLNPSTNIMFSETEAQDLHNRRDIKTIENIFSDKNSMSLVSNSHTPPALLTSLNISLARFSPILSFNLSI